MAKIELKYLRTLRAIRDTGSLVEAAQEIHLTQSALSHQLKELEDRLQCSVLNRKSKPIQFTPAGKILLNCADSMLPALEIAEQEIQNLISGDLGRLHIAIECHSCFDWLMPTIDAFRDQYPDVEIDLLSGFNFEPLPALQKGELDLVVTSDPQELPGISYHPLFVYESQLCLNKKHPLLSKRVIEASDFANETLITYPVEKERLDIYKYLLIPGNVSPKEVRICELTIMMVQLIASGRGVSVLPSWAVTEYLEKGYIAARSLGENGIWPTLYAAVRTDSESKNYIQAFTSLAKTLSRSTLKGVRAS